MGLQAEAFDAQKGVTKTSTNIGYADNGDWLRFDDVNFGGGVTRVTAKLAVSASAAGQTIEFRVGSPTGTLLGSLTPRSTGGWATFANQSASINKVSGVQDLYVVFRGHSGVAVLDSLTFA